MKVARMDLDEDDAVALFAARGEERGAVLGAADALRRDVDGDIVTYVVTRNISYTNVCYFRCGFCAFSKGKLAANLRGDPYLVPMGEIVRRAREAWDRGAMEVCLQGGIHPAFTGDFYLEVCRAIKDAGPGNCTSTLLRRSRSGRAPRLLRSRSISIFGDCETPVSRRYRAPRPRSSTTRFGRCFVRTSSQRASGSRSTTRPTPSGCDRQPRSCTATSIGPDTGRATCWVCATSSVVAVASLNSCLSRSYTWRRRSTSGDAHAKAQLSAKRS